MFRRNLKRFLIFTLAFLLDQYQEMSIKNYYRSFYLPGYVATPQSLHKLVYRMTKIKEIEKYERGGEVYLKLTSKGGSFFNEKISLQKLAQRRWDGLWRLVIFDIKEIERKIRDGIRRKLKNWGFALWQESVYISPHPILGEIDEFLKEKRLFPRVVTLEAKIVGIHHPEKFAWVVFKMGELEKEYLQIEERIEKLKKEKNIKSSSYQEILERFQRAVFHDPFLPKNLIKPSWPRERVKQQLKKLMFS